MIDLKDSHHLAPASQMLNYDQWVPGYNCFPALIDLRVYKEFGFYLAQAEGFLLVLLFW